MPPVDPNPYAPPASPVGADRQGAISAPSVVDGDRLVVPLAYAWPGVCVKCGRTDGLTVRQQGFRWVPPWTNLLLFIGLLPAVVVQAILTRRARLSLPICPACDARWTKARVMWALSVFGPLGTAIALMVAGALTDSGGLMAVAFLLLIPTIIVGPLLVHFLLMRPRALSTTRIDKQTITLRGVAPAVFAALGRPEV